MENGSGESASHGHTRCGFRAMMRFDVSMSAIRIVIDERFVLDDAGSD